MVIHTAPAVGQSSAFLGMIYLVLAVIRPRGSTGNGFALCRHHWRDSALCGSLCPHGLPRLSVRSLAETLSDAFMSL